MKTLIVALAGGLVLSLDRAAKSVTINHGPVQNLGMPPMTMGYQVADPVMLDQIKTGDKVKFHADVIGGVFTVTRIDPASAPPSGAPDPISR